MISASNILYDISFSVIKLIQMSLVSSHVLNNIIKKLIWERDLNGRDNVPLKATQMKL